MDYLHSVMAVRDFKFSFRLVFLVCVDKVGQNFPEEVAALDTH